MPTIQINDTKLTFNITRYKNTDDWTDVIIEVENHYIKYRNSGEILEKAEVNCIIQTLNDLLDDKLKEPKRLSFTEPDISITCYPPQIMTAGMNTEMGQLIYCEKGHSTDDCYIYFTIHFTDNSGAYVNEKWSVALERKEILELLNGIEKETGKRTNDEETVDVIGVSFIEDYTAITWYFDDGELHSDEFVIVKDKSGTERFGLVEYVRTYRKSKLPCPYENLQNIIRHATKEESTQAAKDWRDYWDNK